MDSNGPFLKQEHHQSYICIHLLYSHETQDVADPGTPDKKPSHHHMVGHNRPHLAAVYIRAPMVRYILAQNSIFRP
jgi:hypothetical protein